jgi:hypothetical protein
MSTSEEKIALPSDLKTALQRRLDQLFAQITDDTQKIANHRSKAHKRPGGPATAGTDEVIFEDLSRALEEALGRKESLVEKAGWEWFFDWFPPFTCLSFLLCLLFGILGFLVMTGFINSPNVPNQSTSSAVSPASSHVSFAIEAEKAPKIYQSSGQTGQAPKDLKDLASGFLDIAKIFAGAIVGSTAATAQKNLRSAK